MSDDSKLDELQVLQTIISSLRSLDEGTKVRLLESAITFLGLEESLFERSRSRHASTATASPLVDVPSDFENAEMSGARSRIVPT